MDVVPLDGIQQSAPHVPNVRPHARTFGDIVIVLRKFLGIERAVHQVGLAIEDVPIDI